MAETILATASQKQVWLSKYFQEYVRLSGYKSFMSNADMNKGGIILSRYELQQEAGKTINIPFIGRLKSSGVTGSDVLDGQEEELTNYNMPIAIDWRRNAVRVAKSQQFQTEINLLNAGRDALITWEAEKLRDDITDGFGGVISDTAGTTVKIGSSNTTQRNTWAANNKDRMLFGHLNSNYSATYATALANVGTASDKCTASIMSLGKRLAKAADPHIRPFRATTSDGLREFFVAFHGSRSFRDLKADQTIINSELYARPREQKTMDDNPLFQDGDLFFDGILHREVPELDAWATASGVYDASGASSADVRPIFLAGSGAVGIAWGQMPTPRTDYIKDYGFRPGVAIEELLGVKKINFNGVQNGMVTVHVAAGADS
jgi:N4-gp56 family major capsid protein